MNAWFICWQNMGLSPVKQNNLMYKTRSQNVLSFVLFWVNTLVWLKYTFTFTINNPVLWRKVYLDYSNNLLFTLFTFSGQNFSAFTQCMYLFKANTLTLVFKSSISSLSVYIKGSLISEDILSLVPLPKKGAKFRPWAENMN